MSEELRECPHCGATRGLYTLDEYGGLCVDDDLIAQIFCDNCKSAFENESANNGKELIEAWNTRAERTCTYVEHVDAYGYYYQCSECQYEMDGGEFEHYELAHCMGCGAKIAEVISDER